MLRDRDTQIPNSGDRRIVRRAALQPVDTGADDRLGSVEIRLTNLQMDDAPSLALQLIGTAEHLERGLTPHTLHSFCDTAFCIQLHSANSLSNEMTSKYNIRLREGRVSDKWVRVASLSEVPAEGV